MNRRKSFRYIGAALIVLLIGAVANTQLSGPGRASPRNNPAAAGLSTDTLAALGTNAFSSGVRRDDDFSFFEEFLRNRNGSDDGLIDDKTGRWSKGLRKGAGPDLQRVSDMGEVVSKPSATHEGALLGGERSGSLPTSNSLVGSALLGSHSLSTPGFLVGVISPNAPPPPMPEVPLPPAAILFLSALAGAGFMRAKNKG